MNQSYEIQSNPTKKKKRKEKIYSALYTNNPNPAQLDKKLTPGHFSIIYYVGTMSVMNPSDPNQHN